MNDKNNCTAKNNKIMVSKIANICEECLSAHRLVILELGCDLANGKSGQFFKRLKALEKGISQTKRLSDGYDIKSPEGRRQFIQVFKKAMKTIPDKTIRIRMAIGVLNKWVNVFNNFKQDTSPGVIPDEKKQKALKTIRKLTDSGGRILKLLISDSIDPKKETGFSLLSLRACIEDLESMEAALATDGQTSKKLQHKNWDAKPSSTGKRIQLIREILAWVNRFNIFKESLTRAGVREKEKETLIAIRSLQSSGNNLLKLMKLHKIDAEGIRVSLLQDCIEFLDSEERFITNPMDEETSKEMEKIFSDDSATLKKLAKLYERTLKTPMTVTRTSSDDDPSPLKKNKNKNHA